MKRLKKNLNKILNSKFLIILILLVAAFLRLYRIADYMTFLGDEGRDVLVVYNILHGHLTLLGPTSSVGGFFLGPIYYYFMTPFLFLFNYNPVGPAVMVALFGIATVWLIYYISKDLFNEKVGLIASLLYAISPLVITYSRSSWNPNPLPFFSLLTVYVLYKGLKKSNLKYIFLVGILLGISMQLHYLALFLGAVVFVYTLLRSYYFKKLFEGIKSLVVMFLGFLIGWSPFLAFELRHGFPDLINISNFVVHSGNTGPNLNYFSVVYNVFFRIFGRLIFAFPETNALINFSYQVIFFWQVIVVIFGLSTLGFLIYKLIKSFKDKETFEKYFLLASWFFVGVLLFGFYKKPIYDYYFAFLFPLPFILIALFLGFLENIKIRKLGILILGLIVLGIVSINFYWNTFRITPNRQLNQAETISKFVYDKTDGKPFNFALITGGNSDHAYRYFFTVWGHPPVTIENSMVDPQRKTVTNQLMVVCESIPCYPLGNSLWEIAGFGRAQISGHWNISWVQIYKLVHYNNSK